jgi:DNA-binding MarR family transcriptional regulator
MDSLALAVLPFRNGEVSGYTLEKTAKLMKLSFSRILLLHPELDITVDQWVILQLLAKHEVLSQQEIGELALKDAPTVTRMIDLLEIKGIVARKADKTDKRRYKITLTPLGKTKHQIILPLVQEFRNEAFSGISHTELVNLEKILRKIFDNLHKQN